MNWQSSYAVMYRPDRNTKWDCVKVTPYYNTPWNLAIRDISALNSWGSDPLSGKLDKNGMPEDVTDSRVQALERYGWMNAPNPALSQVRLSACADDSTLYEITIRSFIGAEQTLVLFSKNAPNSPDSMRNSAPQIVMPRPLDYNKAGEPLAESEQTYKAGQWPDYLREMSLWQYVKDPHNFPADLKVQYTYQDASKYAPITCTDTNGNEYTCGYDPVTWNLNATYYLQGDARKAWLISQIMGEIGVRTLGFSYVSAPWSGTGMNFALAQMVLRQKFIEGRGPDGSGLSRVRVSRYPA